MKDVLTVRLAMVWRGWMEQWSKTHAVALSKGKVRASMVPEGYCTPRGFAQIFDQSQAFRRPQNAGLLARTLPGQSSASPITMLLGKLGVKIGEIPPPPFIPKFLLESLAMAPASPVSSVVTVKGYPVLSTKWAPLTTAVDLMVEGPTQEFIGTPIQTLKPLGSSIYIDDVGYPPEWPKLQVNLDSQWERICCAGLDVENRELTAVIQITRDYGYSIDRCDPNMREHVGFWLIEPTLTEVVPQNWDADPDPNPNGPGIRFIGSTNVAVSDIPRNFIHDDYFRYPSGILHHSLKLKISGHDLQWMKQCREPARLPRLHVVLAWDQIVDNNSFNGRGVVFGDVFNCDVEFPLRKPLTCRTDLPGVRVVHIDPDVTSAGPIHVAHLPDGNILFFSGGQYAKHPEDDHDDTEPYFKNSFAIFLTETDTIENVGTPPFDAFCAGHSTLSNGNLLIVGGTTAGRTHQHLEVKEHWPGLDDACVFDWKSRKFLPSWDMYDGRWYPSTVVLGNGEVYVMDGHPTVNSPAHTNFDLEIFARDGLSIQTYLANANPSTGSTDTTPSSNYAEKDEKGVVKRWLRFNEYFVGLYPRLFLMPNGKIFSSSIMRSLATTKSVGHFGSNEDRQTIKIQEKGSENDAKGRVLRDNCYLWDPHTPWEARRVSDGPPGSGPLYGYNDSSVLLPMHVNPTTNNCNYEDVSVLTFVNGIASVIKPLSSKPGWEQIRGRVGTSKTQGTKLDETYRDYGNIVLLPNKRVMFVGGVHTPWRDKVYKEEDIEKAYVGDIEYLDMNIPSKPRWSTDRAVLQVSRRYHSTAILLPDGRVMVAGSDRIKVAGEDDSLTRFQRDIEIITPDFLLGGERPVFEISSETFGYGEIVSVTFLDGWDMTRVGYFSLIRMYSVTHAFGFDQRMVTMYPYGILRQFDVNVRIPNNPSLLPPGYYMLFAVSAKGVPSCSKIIHIS